MRETHFQIINKHCERAGIQPANAFALLLNILESTYSMTAVTQGFAQGAQNTSNVIQDIQHLIGVASVTEVPASLLHLFKAVTERHRQIQMMNAASARQALVGRPDDAKLKAHVEGAEKFVRYHDALIQILNDLINQSETQSLNAVLTLESWKDKDGRIHIDPGPGKPKEPDGGKDDPGAQS